MTSTYANQCLLENFSFYFLFIFIMNLRTWKTFLQASFQHKVFLYAVDNPNHFCVNKQNQSFAQKIFSLTFMSQNLTKMFARFLLPKNVVGHIQIEMMLLLNYGPTLFPIFCKVVFYADVIGVLKPPGALPYTAVRLFLFCSCLWIWGSGLSWGCRVCLFLPRLCEVVWSTNDYKEIGTAGTLYRHYGQCLMKILYGALLH